LLETERKLNNKKILITGGAGFLGSNLTRRLIEDNEITLFIKPKTDLSRIKDILDKFEIIEGDLLDKELVKEVLKDKNYLFHFAWQTDLKKSMEKPLEDVRNDIIGLLTILECCKEANKNIKIIFASTVTVIGIPEKIPSNELALELPLSVYDANKLLAEKYLKVYYENFNIKFCVLRLANVFGEYQKIDNPNRGVLNFMIGKALRGEPLTVYGKGDFIRDYSYVGNFIDAFIIAAESENTNGKVYVLGSGEGKTFLEVVEKIKKIIEEKGKKVEIQFNDVETHKINKRDFVADSTRFRNDTRWIPRISFEEGLRKTIEFYWDN